MRSRSRVAWEPVEEFSTSSCTGLLDPSLLGGIELVDPGDAVATEGAGCAHCFGLGPDADDFFQEVPHVVRELDGARRGEQHLRPVPVELREVAECVESSIETSGTPQ